MFLPVSMCGGDTDVSRMDMACIICMCAVIMLAFFIFLWVRIYSLEIGYRISDDHKVHEELVQENKKLKVERAALKSSSRLETIARQPAGHDPAQKNTGGDRAMVKMKSRNELAKNIRFIAMGFMVLFAVTALRAYFLQVLKSGELTGIIQSQYMTSVELMPYRGTVYDRNGAELAASLDVESLYARPGSCERPKGCGKADCADS